MVAIYDKSVEYISGGSNVPEIKEFFWKWRRHHDPRRRPTWAGCSITFPPQRDPHGRPGRLRRHGAEEMADDQRRTEGSR